MTLGRDGRLVGVGVVGTAVMAAASWKVGGLPIGWGPQFPVTGSIVFDAGLLTFLVAWLLLGRRVLAGSVGAPAVRRFALAVSAPFVAAAPLGRDLWSYAAQGHLVGRGLDPYRVGPGAAPGAFARQVSPRWIDTASPYGPVWLRLSQAAAWVSDGHPLVAVLLLRLPALAGLVLCCWALPALAARSGRRVGRRLAACLWLGVAGPLGVVLGVGGGHNDLLMLGLALAGLAVAARGTVPSLAGGTALCVLAVLVKSPAVIAVAFTVPVWLSAAPGRAGVGSRGRPPGRRVAAGIAVAAASSAASLAAGTAACGLGVGWLRTIGADSSWVSWLSLPSGATMLGRFVAGSSDPRGPGGALHTVRDVGMAVAVTLLVALWLAALRTPARSLTMLTAALTAAALLAPSVQPWYYLWALVVAGLVLTGRRALLGAAFVSLVFPIMTTPSGFGLEGSWAALLVLAFAGVLIRVFLGGVALGGAATDVPVIGRRASHPDAVPAEQGTVLLEQAG